MPIDPLNFGAILIAVIAALGTWASHRQSSKAAIVNEKAKAEVEAYNRARAMDLRTMELQDAEFHELRDKHETLKKRVGEVELRNEELEVENSRLRRRIAALERKQEDRDAEQDV